MIAPFNQQPQDKLQVGDRLTLVEYRLSMFRQPPNIVAGNNPQPIENPLVNSIKEKLGEFDYGKAPLDIEKYREKRGMIEL